MVREPLNAVARLRPQFAQRRIGARRVPLAASKVDVWQSLSLENRRMIGCIAEPRITSFAETRQPISTQVPTRFFLAKGFDPNGGAPVADYQEVAAKISEALNAAEQCSTTETLENYNLLGEQLSELESSARQSLRSQVRYQPLLTKLESGSPLTAEELKTLRSLIVGDADAYLKYDDDFLQSKNELGKVIDEIREIKSRNLDFETLMHLRVLCREASSALGPTWHYLEQKERVRNFEEHTHGRLDNDASRILAGIIRAMAN
jgi:hypothetical protein